MGAGLSVINAAGTLQIDSSFRNMAYSDYFDVVVNRLLFTSMYQEFLTVDPNYIHSYRCLTPGAIAGLGVTGNRCMVVSNVRGAVVRVYRFRRDGAGPRLNYGLEVFDPNGTLSYSSGTQYMNVQGYYPFGSLTQNTTYSFNKRPAIVAGVLGFEAYIRPIAGMDNSWRYFVKCDAFSFSGNSITFGQVADLEEYWDIYPINAEYGSNGTNAIVIDSTRLP